MSQQMRRLETFLKQPVFATTGRNMRLSPAGKELLAYARKMLSLNDEAVARFAPPRDGLRISFGISDQFSDALPEILRSLKRVAPESQLTIRTGVSESLSEQLSDGAQDLALLINPWEDPAYRVEEVGHIEMAWFGRPAIGNDAPLPLVLFTEPCTLRGRTLAAFEESGTEWKRAYEGPELIGLRAAIQAGLGVACLVANADELWGLPTAICPRLPAPPGPVPTGLAISSRVPADCTEAALKSVREALAPYPFAALQTS
ncbi:LysR substrate-binding domain-containing protein [Streptomyces sp. NPDC101150]|uniref:LysR substrate-binding domain-containing protein n=1 Tax=Streptomyces sp. NPDC101150 TaxID=3366114 RepID=UPI00381C704B